MTFCNATKCESLATYCYQRRSNTDEWAQYVAAGTAWATQQGFAPDAFVPTDGLALRIMFGCEEHPVSAAPVHAADCLPGECKCPEDPPAVSFT